MIALFWGDSTSGPKGKIFEGVRSGWLAVVVGAVDCGAAAERGANRVQSFSG